MILNSAEQFIEQIVIHETAKNKASPVMLVIFMI